MTPRARQLMYILAATVPAAFLFVLFPLWQIEHPGDPALILRSERHLLWNRPAHSHVDAFAMAIPVIAVIVVAVALCVLAMRNE
ncbi:MAG TPA: hypothetical protein VG498_23180 [Terriglobales bacterium]|nr:hypothetical protein [Terriglobales bacterium]